MRDYDSREFFINHPIRKLLLCVNKADPERWFNISIQTLKERRYNIRRFDLKFGRCFKHRFNVEFWLMRFPTQYQRCFNVGKVTSIQFAFSTFFQRRFNVVKVISNVGSTLKQHRFARWVTSCTAAIYICYVTEPK